MDTSTYVEEHRIILAKGAKRNLRDRVITANLSALVATVITKGLAVRGWSLTPEPQADSPEGNPWVKLSGYGEFEDEYEYHAYLLLRFVNEAGKAPESYEAESIVKTVSRKSQTPPFGSWFVAMVDAKPYELSDEDEDENARDEDLYGYADVEMPWDEKWLEAFSHLFGLDAHVNRVKKAVEAGIASEWANRLHVALVGPPGCGKSDIAESLRELLGHDAVMKMDATALTSAGAIKLLEERTILPRVLILEEVEKANETALSFLLGVLDQRGEIRKTTARGSIQRDTRLFAVATVNDVAVFRKMMAGALASRFPNTIFFKRPSRDTLALILSREVAKVKGNPAWITPTLDYCQDHKIDDPRTVIAHCLTGADSWLDDTETEPCTYAKELDATSEPKPDEDEKDS